MPDHGSTQGLSESGLCEYCHSRYRNLKTVNCSGVVDGC